MAGTYTYRNLILWQRAQALAFEIIRCVQRLPHNWSNAVIARQVIASATSIGANVAEGHGRYRLAPHRNHLSIAKGSAAETDSWLDLLRRLQVMTDDEEAQLHQECTELIRLLTAKIMDLERLEQNKSGEAEIREQAEAYITVVNEDRPAPPFTSGDYTI